MKKHVTRDLTLGKIDKLSKGKKTIKPIPKEIYKYIIFYLEI